MRTLRLLIPLMALLLTVVVPACSQSPSPEDVETIAALQTELGQVRSEITAAEEKNAKYSGGLIKSLIETRVEILKTTEALVQQRIHALESGADITIGVAGAEPDEEMAKQLQREIDSQLTELESAKEEAATYSGGLIGSMKLATVATQEQTVAMLQQRYLAAKYGLSGAIPAVSTAVAPEQGARSVPSSAASSSDREDSSRQVSVKLLEKRFSEQDYQDYIWLTIEFVATGLDKPARAIKGVLNLQDLFGEPRMSLNWTLDEPIEPGETYVEKGSGFKYNQFIDKHQWVRSTDLADMTASFTVTSILYQDGSRQDF